MEEGTIVRWLKSDGDTVMRGEAIVEIETDKATMPYEADEAGVLATAVAEGTSVQVGTPIAHIGQAAVPVSARAAAPSVRGVSPIARRVAERLGVELDGLGGSGPQGRILKADVIAAAQGPRPVDVSNADTERPRATGAATTEPLSRTQSLIARRMTASRATVPDFELRVEVDMESAVQLRRELKQLRVAGPTPSVNDLVVKATAVALRDHPRANGSFREDRFELHPRVNVGIAVAAEAGLYVPVISDADTKSITTIAEETRAVVERIRGGAARPADLDGATFTVSNLGMYDVRSFSAIINPPQAAILAVGAIVPRPVASGESVVVHHVMDLSLACDHRILYGADAAQFLRSVRDGLERPLRLLL
jgi:pyruvate dehydrogenase E2 component (dihydrolipoamide acetyltransferase)